METFDKGEARLKNKTWNQLEPLIGFTMLRRSENASDGSFSRWMRLEISGIQLQGNQDKNTGSVGLRVAEWEEEQTGTIFRLVVLQRWQSA